MRHFPVHSASGRRKQYVSCHDVAILQVQSLSEFTSNSVLLANVQCLTIRQSTESIYSDELYGMAVLWKNWKAYTADSTMTNKSIHGMSANDSNASSQ